MAAHYPLLRRYPFPLLFLLIALLLAARDARAQIPPLDDDGAGRHYILAFPDTTTNVLDGRYPNTRFTDGFYLFLYSSTPNTAVTITTVSGSRSVRLSAGQFQVERIVDRPVVTRINSVESNTIDVVADAPIVVHCFCATRQGMEAWTPIPVEMWGAEYNAAALPGEIVNDIGIADKTTIPYTRKAAPGEILVIAAYDNTKVTIRPTPWQTLLDSRMPVEVRLNAGQCYQLQSVVDTNASFDGDQVDLGGVSIRADKPIGVISGNTRAMMDRGESGLMKNATKNMMVEWLSSTGQQGTEFVYMPSWDPRRHGTRPGGEREAEFVRIYGTTARDASPPRRVTTFYQLRQGSDTVVPATVQQDSLRQFEYPSPVAVFYKTSDPAQAMMHSGAVLQLVHRTPCSQGIPCVKYDLWAPYMVEMIPREQWGSFAPYYAPDGPAAPMEHYINVVTDTLSMKSIVDEKGNPFPFTRRIPGTDLAWGSIAVTPGVTHYLYGRSGAKFSGFVYGFYGGSEEYRPGDAGPAEYEEYNALSYGYPLAPLRRVLRPADSLEIIEEMNCAEKRVKIRALNTSPIGLLSVELDPPSVVNARLVPVDPVKLPDILGRTSVEVKIVAIDPLHDARGTLLIRDRTGKAWRVAYVYQGERLDVAPGAADFGSIPLGGFKDTVITYTNPLDRDVEIRGASIVSGTNGAGGDGFEIVSTDPPGPARVPAESIVLKKGESFKVHLRLNARTSGKIYDDSLKVILGCAQITIAVGGQGVEPLISVEDLDFGTLIADPSGVSRKTMGLRVCNVGRTMLTFANGGDDVLKWIDTSGLFSVPRSEIDLLKVLTLGPGDCYTLHVSFNPATVGTYAITSRFFANTRDRKDTSVWRGVVELPAGVPIEEPSGYRIFAATPNPSEGDVTIGYTLGRVGHTTITIHDERGALVATLTDGMMGAGEHRVEWDASGMAAGRYYCRVTSGGWRGSTAIVIAR